MPTGELLGCYKGTEINRNLRKSLKLSNSGDVSRTEKSEASKERSRPN
jgi:hypothetical protein